MPLPPDTLRSLERLKSLQDRSAQEDSPQKRRFFKTDSLFLLILLMVLCGISAILLIVDHRQLEKIALIKQQIEDDEKRDEVEVSLGKFESVKSTPGKPGYLSILEYEVSISIGKNMTSLRKIRQTLSHRKKHVHSVIESVINNASPEELREPNLISLKASVKKQLGEVFEEGEISDVMFSRFSMFNLPASL